MDTQQIKQHSFRSVLLKQLFIAISLSFILTIILTAIPAYFLLNNAINSDIKEVETVSYEAINTHLSSGWQKLNIENVYKDVRKEIPSAALFLQKAPQYLDAGDDVIQPSNATKATFLRLIQQVENDERTIIETNLLSNHINAAIPIKFKTECLVCHTQQVQTGEIYSGALGGTMVLQVPMSINHISATSVIVFFIIFLIIFTIIATMITNRLVQRNLLSPLAMLSERIKKLRLSSHEQHINWQRTPQKMVEIDHIDEDISNHIHSIRRIYDKLDALMVTEHQTGLFHKDRFNEVMRYEMFRSHRYKHPISLMIIKLAKVKVLNATAKNLEVEEPGTKYLTFGHILHNDTRETDMSFRLEEQIFAVVAPDTDEAGAQYLKEDIFRRLISMELPQDAERTSATPEYEFTIQVGYSTYIGDNTSPKEILKSAVRSMQASQPTTGRYPPVHD